MEPTHKLIKEVMELLQNRFWGIQVERSVILRKEWDAIFPVLKIFLEKKELKLDKCPLDGGDLDDCFNCNKVKVCYVIRGRTHE
jgi:hypothetical protein